MALKSWIASANDPGRRFPARQPALRRFSLCAQHAHRRRHRRPDPRPGRVRVGGRFSRNCPAKSSTPARLSAQSADGARAAGMVRLCAESRKRFLPRQADSNHRSSRVASMLVPMRDAEMQLPARSATTPISTPPSITPRAWASSSALTIRCCRTTNMCPSAITGGRHRSCVSGAEIHRPCGQTKPPSAAEPSFGPARIARLRTRNGLVHRPGKCAWRRPSPSRKPKQHIFGLCLVNDWSARDIQSWEYQPLGPFLAKNFATTISPWIVTLEALAPYRVPVAERPAGDPAAASVSFVTAAHASHRRDARSVSPVGADAAVEHGADVDQPRQSARSLLDPCAAGRASRQQRLQSAHRRPAGHGHHLRARAKARKAACWK